MAFHPLFIQFAAVTRHWGIKIVVFDKASWWIVLQNTTCVQLALVMKTHNEQLPTSISGLVAVEGGL